MTLGCIRFLALSLAMLSSSTVFAQDFDKGLTAYYAGDFATALDELRPLAEEGNADAQKKLGDMYSDGKGVPQSYSEAVIWYGRAAEQGKWLAQIQIGTLYLNGRGVLQDYAEAMNWFSLAAKQGSSYGQFYLGTMYSKGEGVLQNNITAHMWYNISNANGFDFAASDRDFVAKKMTPENISEAQARARECMESGYENCGW